jgi:hypothetical protein
MSTLTSRPLSLLHVDFADLYARHLCRHSQFGINVVHLIALFGVWLGVYGAIYRLVPVPWLPIGMAASYLVLVAINAPVRVCLPTAAFLALFVATVLYMPEQIPWWAYLPLVPVFYKIQAWSHKVWTMAADMTEFNKRYPKGTVLFFVLLIYEVPMLLNFFVFGRKDWRA